MKEQKEKKEFFDTISFTPFGTLAVPVLSIMYRDPTSGVPYSPSISGKNRTLR